MRPPLTLFFLLLWLLWLLSCPFSGFCEEEEEEADYYYQKAKDFLFSEQILEASNFFENAVHSDPQIFFLMSGNGIFERLLQDSEKNVAENTEKMCLTVLAKKEGIDGFVYYYLGWAEWILEKKQKSLQSLKKALKLMEEHELETDLVTELLQAVRASPDPETKNPEAKTPKTPLKKNS